MMQSSKITQNHLHIITMQDKGKNDEATHNGEQMKRRKNHILYKYYKIKHHADSVILQKGL